MAAAFRRFFFALIAAVTMAISLPLIAGEGNDGTNVVQVLTMGMPFGDNAVLQQKIPLPVWGSAKPGAKVTVEFDNQTKTAAADAGGRWRVVLDPMTAVKLNSVNDKPSGMKMIVMSEADGTKEVKEINNILVGEVWLCAGQSNMAGKMGGTRIEGSDYPSMRQMVTYTNGPWLVCTPEGATGFRRVCYYFAKRLHGDILVPIGIINSAVGGSKIETWLNQKPFERGGNYDKFIEPLVGFGLRGAVWYQGESNEKDRRDYNPKLVSLITGWRNAWNQPSSELAGGPQRDFSTYFVQLPNIGRPTPVDPPAGGDGRAEIRQAQFEVLAITNTGMSVGIDIGAEGEHPPNKYDAGIRLARWALHRDYGFTDLVPSGPLYKSFKIEGDSIRIFFDYAGNGLMLAKKEGREPPVPTPDAKMPWLAIQAKDGTWHWADGRIDGSELVVSAKEVKEPVAVRYAYRQYVVGSNLYNKDGLPAAPFSTCGY